MYLPTPKPFVYLYLVVVAVEALMQVLVEAAAAHMKQLE
jgi:hypothetical protein